MQLRIGDATVYGPSGSLEDAATAPLRIADRTWVMTVKDPGGPGFEPAGRPRGAGDLAGGAARILVLDLGPNERMQELERQASQDALTGLSNRRRFEEDLGTAMARSRRDGSPGRC